jgi:hypothetical protein
MAKPSPVAHATIDTILHGITPVYETAEGGILTFAKVGKAIPAGCRIKVNIGTTVLVDGTNANMLRKLSLIAKIAIDNGLELDGLSMLDLETQAFGAPPVPTHDLTPTATTATRSKRRSSTPTELPDELAPVVDTILVGVAVEDDEDLITAVANELKQDIAIDNAATDDDDEYEDDDEDEDEEDEDED